MTNTDHTRPQRPTADDNRSRRASVAAARRRRHAANFSDAVITAYVHEISARHRRGRPDPAGDAHMPLAPAVPSA
jgi:hypothetical protein